MRKKAELVLALCALLTLAGCGPAAPQKAADGLDWDENWVTVGNILGVDTPGGLEPRENSDALSAKGMYYATWSIGEAEPYVNADGEDAEIYDTQVYLLLAGYDAAEKAEDAAAEWLEMASEQYQVEHTFEAEHNGQTYSAVTYTCASETNPYARGASAFGAYGNYAISVEIQCREESDTDPRGLMDSFLQNCHYAA